MGEKEIRIGNLKLAMMKHYKQWGQFILGITINKEDEYFTPSNSNHQLKGKKFELNIWLFLVSFHVTLLGKLKKI